MDLQSPIDDKGSSLALNNAYSSITSTGGKESIDLMPQEVTDDL